MSFIPSSTRSILQRFLYRHRFFLKNNPSVCQSVAGRAPSKHAIRGHYDHLRGRDEVYTPPATLWSYSRSCQSRKTFLSRHISLLALRMLHSSEMAVPNCRLKKQKFINPSAARFLTQSSRGVSPSVRCWKIDDLNARILGRSIWFNLGAGLTLAPAVR